MLNHNHKVDRRLVEKSLRDAFTEDRPVSDDLRNRLIALTDGEELPTLSTKPDYQQQATGRPRSLTRVLLSAAAVVAIAGTAAIVIAANHAGSISHQGVAAATPTSGLPLDPATAAHSPTVLSTVRGSTLDRTITPSPTPVRISPTSTAPHSASVAGSLWQDRVSCLLPWSAPVENSRSLGVSVDWRQPSPFAADQPDHLTIRISNPSGPGIKGSVDSIVVLIRNHQIVSYIDDPTLVAHLIDLPVGAETTRQLDIFQPIKCHQTTTPNSPASGSYTAVVVVAVTQSDNVQRLGVSKPSVVTLS